MGGGGGGGRGGGEEKRSAAEPRLLFIATARANEDKPKHAGHTRPAYFLLQCREWEEARN